MIVIWQGGLFLRSRRRGAKRRGRSLSCTLSVSTNFESRRIVLVLHLFRAVQTETVRLPCEASASDVGEASSLCFSGKAKRGRFAYAAFPAAHFERNDITIICETVH